jgi:urease accessory protein
MAVLLAWAAVEPALAHIDHGAAGSGRFGQGFLHPVTGLDHLVAMVAVGLWGAQLGARAIWLLPIVFPLVMAIGGFAGLIGVPLPAVDAGVALSGIVLGVVVLAAARPPLWVAAALIAAFGLLHGHAHGTAMPLSGSPAAFAAGFVLATGLLHASGILIGLLARWPAGAWLVRGAGGVIALGASSSFAALVAGAL